MSLRTSIRAGLAAITIATAPLSAAAKKVAPVVADSVKIENTVMREGDKWVSVTRRTNKNTGKFISEARVTSSERPAGYRAPGEPKEQEGHLKLGADFSTRDILGLRTHEPRVKAQFDARSGIVYFRPEAAVGTQSYNAVVPLGFQFNVAPKTTLELGSDIAGVRGFLNGDKVFFQKDVDKVVSGQECKAHSYSGEFFQNLHVGARYNNGVVNASVRGEAGRTAYIGGGFVKESAGSTLSEIQASGTPIVNKQSSGYVGARADVEVAPLPKNRNILINAQGAVSTNKGAEGAVGIVYKYN